MSDYQRMPHQGIQGLVPYKAGKSAASLAREQGISNIIKLASNENPLGCSQAVLDYFKRLSTDDIATYPDAQQHPLRAALAERNGLAESQVVISNGSDALFSLLMNLFCLHRNKHLLTHDYAFASYSTQAQTLGVDVKKVAVENDFSLDLDVLRAHCNADTGLIIFANPNNPTGNLIRFAALQNFLKSIPSEVIVLIDEAYFEFAFEGNEKSALSFLKQCKNLVITRTFSKVYGLAGLRVGYLLASEVLSELIWRVQLPFVNSSVSLNAALIALDDQAFVQQSVQLNRQGLQQITKGLELLNVAYLPSAGNFITFKSRCGENILYNYLLQRGIIVRPLQAYGLVNYLRVSIGTTVQNERFLSALQQFFKDKHA